MKMWVKFNYLRMECSRYVFVNKVMYGWGSIKAQEFLTC